MVVAGGALTSAVLNIADALHAAVTSPVVYVLSDSLPPQPLTVSITKPVFGVTVNVTVVPCGTARVAGLMLPPALATAFTVNVGSAVKNASTRQLPLIGPVVHVVELVMVGPPRNTMPQPLTLVRRKPALGVTVTVVAAPELIFCVPFGLMLPPVSATMVT